MPKNFLKRLFSGDYRIKVKPNCILKKWLTLPENCCLTDKSTLLPPTPAAKTIFSSQCSTYHWGHQPLPVLTNLAPLPEPSASLLHGYPYTCNLVRWCSVMPTLDDCKKFLLNLINTETSLHFDWRKHWTISPEKCFAMAIPKVLIT